MSAVITLDGQDIVFAPGESIWEIARRTGCEIPHLCHKDQAGYRPDGNCRSCMVEVEGERGLVPSCRRQALDGMVVATASARAKKARSMVIELLLADQPPQSETPRVGGQAPFWEMARRAGVSASRFAPRTQSPAPDLSHPAIAVDLSACISCGLCSRACREVQVNDVIGMAGRGAQAFPTFDVGDPLGRSSCVACGECVQACPTEALSAVVVAAATPPRAPCQTTETVCPFCGVGCKIKVHTVGGKILEVEGADGPANEGKLCVKGRFGFDYTHHPHRLQRPLIRREDAPPKGLNVDPENPLAVFREASWEEALTYAANGLRACAPDQVAGFGSAKCTNEEAYLFQKLIRQGFGHNNVDHCTRLCHASSVTALIENIGSGAVTASFNEIENADVAIIIGANPAENHPVAATYFKQFAKRGGKLIVMDPRGQDLARHAEEMVQFRPGTDVALLNAIMHVIVAEELFDAQYIAQRCEDWDSFRDHLHGFPPEDMSPICGVAPSQIRAIARLFAQSRAGMIFWGMGVSQHVHGTDNARCLISLALMCGFVGRPGTGLHPLRGQNNVQGASDAGLIPMFGPDYRPVGDKALHDNLRSIWGGGGFSAEPGLTVTETLDAARRGDIRAMVVQGENPAMSDPDALHARAALARLDHLVVQDIFLTETANFADVILPASSLFEKSGTVTNTNRQVQRVRPAIPPPGEARQDWCITQMLAKALGLGWAYESPRDIFDEMVRAMPSLDNITWERLGAGTVAYPSLGPEDPGQSVVFDVTFPREGGRAKFTPAGLISPDDVPDADYPMIMTTGRQLEHWHTGSMTRRSRVLDAVEPEANCSLHPATLARLGIAPGTLCKVSSRRGSITIMARADRAVAPDMVFVPFAYVEAAANVLTNPSLDPYAKIPEFKFAAVRIEPAPIDPPSEAPV